MQIQPTIDLLQGLDREYPEILQNSGINPQDYHQGKVFRSAVESIRGSFIAGSRTSREGMIADVLTASQQMGLIEGFSRTTRAERHDFSVVVDPERTKRLAIEVKGGEGNSINISERPIWADEFIVWSHLDGAVKNQPRYGAGQIIFNRLANEIIKRDKRIDVFVIKDALCGTRSRPCPKYANKVDDNLNVAPCIFLLPRRIPSRDDTSPPPHDIDSLVFPKIILETFSVPEVEYMNHVYEVRISLEFGQGRTYKRNVQVSKQGRMIEERESRMRL